MCFALHAARKEPFPVSSAFRLKTHKGAGLQAIRVLRSQPPPQLFRGSRSAGGRLHGKCSRFSRKRERLAYTPAPMQNGLLFFRWVFTGLFLLTLVGGILFFRNNGGFFKADPDLPSENSSARSYNKAQMLLIWAHALVLTACMALRLH